MENYAFNGDKHPISINKFKVHLIYFFTMSSSQMYLSIGVLFVRNTLNTHLMWLMIENCHFVTINSHQQTKKPHPSLIKKSIPMRHQEYFVYVYMIKYFNFVSIITVTLQGVMTHLYEMMLHMTSPREKLLTQS